MKRKPSIKGLTDKAQLFCLEYIKDFNRTKAAIRAGYSEATAYSIGQRLLKKVEIQARIEYNRAHLEEALGISKSKILDEHFKIAFSSIAHLHLNWITRKEFEDITEDQKACISEIDTKVVRQLNPETEKREEVEYIRIRLYDKQKALDSISKIMGYDAPAKFAVETNTPIPFVNVSKQFPEK